MSMPTMIPQNNTSNPSTWKFDADLGTNDRGVLKDAITKLKDVINQLGFWVSGCLLVYAIIQLFICLPVIVFAVHDLRSRYPKIRRNHRGLGVITIVLVIILCIAALPIMWIVALILINIRSRSKRRSTTTRVYGADGSNHRDTAATGGASTVTSRSATASSGGQRTEQRPPTYSSLSLAIPPPTYSPLSADNAQQMFAGPGTCTCGSSQYGDRGNGTFRPRQTTCHCVPVDHHPDLPPEYQAFAHRNQR